MDFLGRGPDDSMENKILNIFGAYILDLFYNNLYENAVKMKSQKQAKSITEGYRHTVFRLITVISTEYKEYSKARYVELLNNMLQRFQIHLGSRFGLSEMIDRITKEFIPHDIHDAMAGDDKRKVMQKIVNEVFGGFGFALIRQHLAQVIDFHEEKDNVRIIGALVKEFFDDCRERNYKKFMAGERTRKQKIEEELSELRGTVLWQENHIKNLTAELSEKNRQLSDMKNKGGRPDADAMKIKSDYEIICEKYNNLVGENEKMKEVTKKLIEQIKQKDSELRAKPQLPHNEIEPLKDKIIDLESETNRLKNVIQSLEREKEDLNKTLVEAKNLKQKSGTKKKKPGKKSRSERPSDSEGDAFGLRDHTNGTTGNSTSHTTDNTGNTGDNEFINLLAVGDDFDQSD